jgi:hypothetical protein
MTSVPSSLRELPALTCGLTVGTCVLTQAGLKPVEELRPGCRLLSKDSGYATLRAVSFHDIDLRSQPSLAPIRIGPDSFGQDNPSRDIFLAPMQRIALRHPIFATMFGAREVLAQAADLTGHPTISPLLDLRGITYVSLELDRPHILLTPCLALDVGCAGRPRPRPVLSHKEAQLAAGLFTQRRRIVPFPRIAQP